MWKVRRWENGKARRTFHESKTAATKEAEDLRRQVDQVGHVWLSLPAADRERLIAAYSAARAKGIDLHKAIAAYQHNPSGDGPAVETVIKELKQSRLSNGAAPGYVTNLVIVLKQFARGREALEINKFTLSDVEKFLESKSLQYRPTLRGKLSTLFNFAIRRGYRADNPCDRLESVKLIRKIPEVFTVAQIKAAVKWLAKHEPDGLPWFGLSTFCGLRPEEAAKTTKADIHFPEGFIRVEAQTTKVRARRVVYPRAEAMAFLKWALKHGSLPLSPESRRSILSGRKTKSTGLRGALRFKVWPKDITRHTAASYWLACENETVRHVAKMLGHSESICESRYKAIKTQEEAVKFWKAVKGLYGKT